MKKFVPRAFFYGKKFKLIDHWFEDLFDYGVELDSFLSIRRGPTYLRSLPCIWYFGTGHITVRADDGFFIDGRRIPDAVFQSDFGSCKL